MTEPQKQWSYVKLNSLLHYIVQCYQEIPVHIIYRFVQSIDNKFLLDSRHRATSSATAWFSHSFSSFWYRSWHKYRGLPRLGEKKTTTLTKLPECDATFHKPSEAIFKLNTTTSLLFVEITSGVFFRCKNYKFRLNRPDLLCYVYILGFDFTCLYFIIIHYHTQEQRRIKLKPRITLNHNIHVVSNTITTIRSKRKAKSNSVTWLTFTVKLNSIKLSPQSLICLTIGIQIWRGIKAPFVFIGH